MHSCEPAAAAPTMGPHLLLELGRLIVRARSPSPRSTPPRDRLRAKIRMGDKPSTSQVQTQPKPDPERVVQAQLDTHVNALWSDHIPVCIEVLLAPDCQECYASLSRIDEEASYDRMHTQQRGLLLERWTMRPIANKPHETPAFMTSQWLLNAVRSQLHFSQLSAWLARLKRPEDHTERRRKLSREKCNYKKVESNCDDPSSGDERQLNIVYSIKIPGESYKMAEFTKPATDHVFPVTDIGNNTYLKVSLESLPRIDEAPFVKCTCPKRKHSKDNTNDDLIGKLNDLTINKYDSGINTNAHCSTSRRLSIISNPGSTEYIYSTEDKGKIVDDRMHTPCSENGKHKCSCDDESDNRSSISLSQEPKKLDERRLKEIAKYKRRLRKENKLKKLCDSTSSEGEVHKTEKINTSIPILQAARFDRFRAIGCYRNQTYLTLPASRVETRSPFIDAVTVPPQEFKRTVSVSTQTDDFSCVCGTKINTKCDECRMVRSEGNYNLASIDKEINLRRKLDEDKSRKLCDTLSNNSKCDKLSIDDDSFNIKRPKLRRFFPILDKIEKVVSDRLNNTDTDMELLHLRTDDTVFSVPKEPKRHKTFSINDDDYIMMEKCDYGTFDTISPKDDTFHYPGKDKDRNANSDSDIDVHNNGKSIDGYENAKNDKSKDVHENAINVFKNDRTCNENDQASTGFSFHHHNHATDLKTDKSIEAKAGVDGKPEKDNSIPSPSEMDKFRWRFDSAASMVFHTKTGLPLTSSPAPLRRGNNCFDFDDSINGISGIKSALFHPISPPSPSPIPSSPASPAPAPRSPPISRVRTTSKKEGGKLRIGPSTGLLGSFEESALKGRIEPVATVHGFSAELGASGAFCPPHQRLPVTVFFYAPGGTNAPYMGHINLGPCGYRVARSGTIQVSLFNPHGTLVKMFVVLYDLTCMPANARTFLRQRTLYMPANAPPPSPHHFHKWLRYLIHLRFMTSKSGKLYLHTDIRIIVSRKADLDTATAHSSLFRPLSNHGSVTSSSTNESAESPNESHDSPANGNAGPSGSANRAPNRVFGGCSEYDSEIRMREIGYENQNGVSYELRSFTYAPDNPRYSPR